MNREDELAELLAEIAQLRADNVQLQQILTRALTQVEANQNRLERISAQSAALEQGVAQQSTSSDDLPSHDVTELASWSASPPRSPQARPDRQRGARASRARRHSQDAADQGSTTHDPPLSKQSDFTDEQLDSLAAAYSILLKWDSQHRAEHPELYLPLEPTTARFEICNDYVVGIDEARKVAVATSDPVWQDLLRKAEAESLTDEENDAYYESLRQDEAVHTYYKQSGYFVRHEEQPYEEVSSLKSRLQPVTTKNPRQARVTLGRLRRDPRQPFVVRDGQTIECKVYEQVEYVLTIYDAELTSA